MMPRNSWCLRLAGEPLDVDGGVREDRGMIRNTLSRLASQSILNGRLHHRLNRPLPPGRGRRSPRCRRGCAPSYRLPGAPSRHVKLSPCTVNSAL